MKRWVPYPFPFPGLAADQQAGAWIEEECIKRTGYTGEVSNAKEPAPAPWKCASSECKTPSAGRGHLGSVDFDDVSDQCTACQDVSVAHYMQTQAGKVGPS